MEQLRSSSPDTADATRVRVVFGALLLGFLLAALDQTVVATALPTILRELGGLYQLSWVVTAYALAATVSTPVWGKLGDLYGRKRVFQAVIVLFLAGSALCGLSPSLAALIAFRGLQGLGAGGLLVTAQAIVADIFDARDRARYQGFIGAVFGASSVAGPLVGGWFVEHLSWRWVFYVNLPVGIVALVVIALVLPQAAERRSHAIDYLGAGLITLGATGLVLLTTLGGTTFPWASVPISVLAGISLALLVAFVAVERRAREPILAPSLLRNRVVVLTSAIGFVALFALVGVTTYISLFLQLVNRASPTGAGLLLAPMTAGAFLSSIVSGQLISRWGHYKLFPLVGTTLLTLGLVVLSGLSEETSPLVTSGYLLMLGFGVGLVMQVMIIAVQNAVPQRDLGAATSAASFFRSLGGSFGVATFGAVFANLLAGKLADLSGVATGISGAGALSNLSALDRLPPEVQAGVLHVVATSLDGVFLLAAPVAAVALVLALFLPEVPLRPREELPRAEAGAQRPRPGI